MVIPFRFGGGDGCAFLPAGFADAAEFVATPAVFDGLVDDGDFFGSGFVTTFDYAGHQFGVCIAGELWGGFPTYIRFENHCLSGFDKALHAAKGGDAGVEHVAWFAVSDSCEVRRGIGIFSR